MAIFPCLTLAGRHPDDGHAGQRPPGRAPDLSGASQELAGRREPLTSCWLQVQITGGGLVMGTPGDVVALLGLLDTNLMG